MSRAAAIVIAGLVACQSSGPATAPPTEAPPATEPTAGTASPPPATPEPPPPSGVSRADCAAILDKADQLMGHDSTTHPRDPGKRAREIDECVANATPAMLACAQAATSMDELEACEKR